MKKVVLLFFVDIVMILAIAGFAIIAFPVLTDLNESQQIQVEIQQEEIQKEQFYHTIEEICLEYSLGKNELLVEKFNTFLEENDIRQESILDYTKRLKTYNGIKYDEYVEAEKQLEDALNNQQISEETFQKEKDILFREYENNKNTLEDYLNSREKTVFENSKETISTLSQLI